eukprot:1649722-Rhodomonas_salina.1
MSGHHCSGAGSRRRRDRWARSWAPDAHGSVGHREWRGCLRTGQHYNLDCASSAPGGACPLGRVGGQTTVPAAMGGDRAARDEHFVWNYEEESPIVVATLENGGGGDGADGGEGGEERVLGQRCYLPRGVLCGQAVAVEVEGQPGICLRARPDARTGAGMRMAKFSDLRIDTVAAHIFLRARYAMSGTNIVYGAKGACATPGTDIAYGATRRASVRCVSTSQRKLREEEEEEEEEGAQ